MSTDVQDAINDAQGAAKGRPEEFLHGIASRVGLHSNAAAVFGDPVDGDGITVVPVAKVRWGFGGGSGSGKNGDEDSVGEGAGGGGGAMASPLGFIEIKNGQAEFRRVKDPGSLVGVILASAVAFWIATRALRSLFR